MEKVPDWIQAGVAVALLGAGAVGMYLGLSAEIASVSSKLESTSARYDTKIDELDRNQTYLQAQVSDNERSVIVLNKQIEGFEKTQNELSTGFKELASELRRTNELLIEMRTESRVVKEFKDGRKETAK